MTRKRLYHVVLGLMLLLLPTATAAANSGPPAIHAQAAILMDAKTGEVLYGKNIHTHCAPASTTKIMTAILAIESGHLDDTVKISARAASTAGSSMHLYPGQEISLRELLTGLLLRSGNDAAVAIAEHLAGSVDAFIEIMNQKAQVLGAYNTHFVNPHGLSRAGHYSSAFDLAWIARYALRNPIFAQIVGTRETAIDWQDRSGREQGRQLRNTNKLLWMFDEADGVKTGTTNEAGPCLVSSATRGNQKLIAVVLHDHNRWDDSMRLLQYGLDHYDLYDYANEGEVLTSLPVENGLEDATDVVIAGSAAMVVKTEDYPHVNVEIDLPPTIKAPVYQGQKIGELIFYINDKAVKTVDLTSAKDVAERTPTLLFFQFLSKTFRLLSSWGLL
ncbi:peptidase s11 d-alanyl-d-alanine carboxypeptidase a [Lucifera butyrica]|uniref:serine-type D-Ala-D-Ala carboxypeptidase n=1 Tax=Lucifera butyrica TaxID=1351585 RepID=A0A498R1K6_9FIRM|nr:D-alanyl-D-alanine carboxypeptidase family protein [Lucifera butyrica]VBB05324.1 peptidase s11 d-alanyl-d-alanine carboxypeptidase a [Lucifera butyrica]